MTLTEITEKYALSDANVAVLKAAGYEEGKADLFEVVTHFIKKGNVDAFKHFIEHGYKEKCNICTYGYLVSMRAVKDVGNSPYQR